MSFRIRMPNRKTLLWLGIGMASQVKLKLVGEIYLGEIAALGALGLMIFSGRLRREELKFLALAIMLACVQVVSDLVNDTAPESMAKGIASPLVFAGTIVALARGFAADQGRVALFVAGNAMALLVQVALIPNEYQLDNPWKWGAGLAVLTLAMTYAMGRTRFTVLPISLFVIMFTAISFMNSARSLAGLTLFGTILYLLAQRGAMKPLLRLFAKGFPVLNLVVPTAFAVFLVDSVTRFVFSKGLFQDVLSNETYQKYSAQALADSGMVLSGRSEILISMNAFLDSPWLGHGSWAVDRHGYVQQYLRLMFEAGITDNIGRWDLTIIPAHSFIMSSLVWAGIMGGVFWLVLTNKALKKYLADFARLPWYFHVMFVFFLWNLLFSPFGGDNRWQTAIFLAALFGWRANQKVRGAR